VAGDWKNRGSMEAQLAATDRTPTSRRRLVGRGCLVGATSGRPLGAAAASLSVPTSPSVFKK
jgi:hypothetical protein